MESISKCLGMRFCSRRNSLAISLKPSLFSPTDLAVREADLCEICANAACAGCFWIRTKHSREDVSFEEVCAFILRDFHKSIFGLQLHPSQTGAAGPCRCTGVVLEQSDQVPPAVQFWQQGDCEPHLRAVSSARVVSRWNKNVLGTLSFSTVLLGLEHDGWNWTVSCSLFNT